jgi:serine/threonine-protein kinase
MLSSGDSFERYTIEAPIGQGGMGSVYRAFDERLGRRVALKVISDPAAGPDANARLVREARAAAALDHPNAISIFDVGEAGGTPYIVMELVSGKTLRSAVEAGTIPLATRLEWLVAVARALDAAHRRGLVHRDIKPENVMVRDDGVVKVLDFGIARRSSGSIDPHAGTESPAIATLTIAGVRLGTPIYMAPEQIRDQALDGRADQFAWGVLAFELLAGKPPWRVSNDAFAVVASILTDEPDGSELDKAGAPGGVRDVILRALSKRPEARFATMDELLRALTAAIQGEPLPARSLPPERAPGSSTEAQRYSTQEVRDVLAKAVEKQGAGGKDTRLGFEDLLAIAREVGVDEETLREASRALRKRDDKPLAAMDAAEAADESAAWIRRRRVAFYRHFGVWVIVNVALVLLGILVPGPLWPFFIPALMWGIGLGIHGLIALTSSRDDWADEKKRMDWWLEQRQRRHEVAMARATGKPVPPSQGRGAGRKLRVEAPAEGERRRVRVETETERDEAAEEEAEAAEAGEKRRSRR